MAQAVGEVEEDERGGWAFGERSIILSEPE